MCVLFILVMLIIAFRSVTEGYNSGRGLLLPGQIIAFRSVAESYNLYKYILYFILL